MVNVWPAIVAVPVRVVPVLFVVALSVAVPLPEADGLDVTLSHGSLLAAVQLQPIAVKMKTLDVVAAAPVDTLTGDIEYVHAPACEIWKIVVPIEIVPARTNTPVFA